MFKTILIKSILFIKDKVYIERWRLTKHFIIASLMFSPALISFFFHLENEYYTRTDNLLSFLAFSFTAFCVLVIFNIKPLYLIPFVLFAIFCDAYHLAIGKPIGFQTMAAMYETNLDEMLGFLSSPYSIPLLLGGCVGAGLLVKYILCDKPMFAIKGSTHIKRSYLIVLMLVSLVLFFLTGKNIQFTYPIDVFWTNFQYIEESHREITYLKTPYTYKSKDELKPNIYMLIIGEAARRDALGAYGNKLQTTPNLDKFIKNHPDNVILFKNAISVSAYTRGSVPTMLSTFDVKDIKNLFARPSLSKMFRGAGFKTLYVTTRPKYLHRNLVSIFQDDAEQSVYLTKLTDKKYDAAAIPVIESFIDKYSDSPRFIVFHLMGSHIKYSMQYPENEKHFKSDNSMNDSYYDSIRYSDKVIMKAVNLIFNQKCPAFAIYASDHGENLNDYGDGNYGHGTKNFTQFEFRIPFMIFFNEPFAKKYSEQIKRIRGHAGEPLNQDYISHTLLSLADIKDSDLYSEQEDLTSPSFKRHARIIIDENMNTYDYDKLKLENRKPKEKNNEKN